jgi:hypothetical protein
MTSNRPCFGNPFGLALYDKQQREVTGAAVAGGARPTNQPAARPTALRVVPTASAPAQNRAPSAQEGQRAATSKTEPSAAAQAPSTALDPGLAPLDPGTIRQLHATIRALPAPVLEGFSKAFRKRFQVPNEAASIADRICQRRHHDWIETFLVSQR